MKKKIETTASSTVLICNNKRALHDFSIAEKYEAGIVLSGTEVKSCRAGKAHLNDAYIKVIRNEVFLIGGHIAEYSHGNQFNHEILRSRKLLLHRTQINKIMVKLNERGYTAVPLSMYFLKGRIKVEFGIGKGKKEFDRRADIKSREADREVARAMRRGSR